jgi:hypothetical protein
MKGGSILEYIPKKSNGTTSTSCCNKGTSAIAWTTIAFKTTIP